ncbi:MAG TPA: hypothetical protein VF184_10500 [Phycisphaeraceae bacterium]
MKQDSPQAKHLVALLKRLGAAHSVELPPQRDPVTQMVVSFLQWEATRKQAEKALERLLGVMVDINELRVSFEHEILDALGRDYPRAQERVARMRESLNEVYRREHAMEMRSIAGKNKKEQRAYLDTLPGITPYVAAQVMLLSLGGHALPVDQKLVALLASEKVVEPDTPPEQAEAQLLRQIKADQTLHVHLLLQAWSDATKSVPTASGAGARASGRGSAKAAGRSSGGKKAQAVRTAASAKKKPAQRSAKRSKKK